MLKFHVGDGFLCNIPGPVHRVSVKESVRKEVYDRAGGRCENPLCRKRLGYREGHNHHVRDPSKPPSAEDLERLCKRCHRMYGHTWKSKQVGCVVGKATVRTLERHCVRCRGWDNKN